MYQITLFEGYFWNDCCLGNYNEEFNRFRTELKSRKKITMGKYFK